MPFELSYYFYDFLYDYLSAKDLFCRELYNYFKLSGNILLHHHSFALFNLEQKYFLPDSQV